MLPHRVRDLERLGRMSSIERSYRETAKDYAYRIIRDSIVNFGKKPGETISDMEISRQLGLSRTPVREAIMKLKSESEIIDIYPQRGMRVSLIDMDLVRQARLLRMTLEKEVAMDCCDYVTAEDLTKLEENLALQEFYCQRGMLPELIQKDNEFHHQLFCISRNEMLYRVVHAVSIHYDRVRNL
jgi:DNA-binding GntR family transcriptional regulator